MSTTAGSSEFTLEITDRLINREFTKEMADAKIIQNIIFGNPTLGCKDIFLNVNTYLREQNTQDILDEISSKLRNLISTYAPEIQVSNLVVTTSERLNKDISIVNSLVIYMTLGEASRQVAFASVLQKSGNIITKSFF